MLNDKFFDYATRIAASAIQNDELRVCHGFLSPDLGPGGADVLGDYSQAFAWIELGGRVYHYEMADKPPVDGQKASLATSDFYRLYQPTFVSKYPARQAVQMSTKTASAGPWIKTLIMGKAFGPDADTQVTNKVRARKEEQLRRAKKTGQLTFSKLVKASQGKGKPSRPSEDREAQAAKDKAKVEKAKAAKRGERKAVGKERKAGA